MWKCSKCGETIEDQFDSCWKCAAQATQTSPPKVATLTWRDYASAVFVAYLIPWLAILLRAVLFWRYWSDYPWPFRRLLIFSDFSIVFWMMIPAAISFLALWPFLPFRIGRRVAVVIICLLWMYLETANHLRTNGYQYP